MVKWNKATRGTLAAAGLALVLTAAGCGGSGGAAAGGASGGAGGAVTIKASEFKFDPGTFKVAAPGDVSITLQNSGAVEHDLTIEGVSGKLLVKAGQTGKATFKVPKAGTYNFTCTVTGHKEAGMKGTLTVG